MALTCYEFPEGPSPSVSPTTNFLKVQSLAHHITKVIHCFKSSAYLDVVIFA